MIKLTYGYVKEYIESFDWALLSTEYSVSNAKLQMVCPEGHRRWITWSNFKTGGRCRECFDITRGDNMRMDINDVKDSLESFGWALLSTEYVNSGTSLLLMCPDGHERWMKWNNFQQGDRCGRCSGMDTYTIEDVREHLENDGWRLLSTEYINSTTKLRMMCPEGHEQWKVWVSFNRGGTRCAECCGLKKLTIEYVREYFEHEGWTLLSTEYVRADAKLLMMCPDEHEQWKSWSEFKTNGNRCPSCAEHGFNPEKPAILYYLEILHRGRLYYKIGITNNTVAKRYNRKRDRKKIKILATWEYEYGGDAYDEEQKIIQCYEKFLYRGNAKILDGAKGNAELFTKDVLLHY